VQCSRMGVENSASGAMREHWNGGITLTCSLPSAMEGKGRATGEYDRCAAGIGCGAYECPRWGSVTALKSGAAPTAPGCLGSAALTYGIPNRSTTAYSLLHRCSICFGGANAYKSMQRNSSQNRILHPRLSLLYLLAILYVFYLHTPYAIISS
jgi:hypothetical protein